MMKIFIFYNDTPREESANSLKDSSFDRHYHVAHKAAGVTLFADNDHIRVMCLGPILFDPTILGLLVVIEKKQIR